MIVEVQAFGIVKDIFKKKSVQVQIQINTTSHLREVLESQYPDLKTLSVYKIAVNEEYVSNEMMLSEGDEIAIIPPVSGG
ncbi:MAG: molybdopterin converting factor subunit 1 [Saprospiraceae bacterium]|uniref:Molybdopterin synthase sulfur carrier subunit n=1 Tax=Candidatus Opimibacter skivensis TaxID=2982028 RepID=A0A9D7SY04_9BACT|nr:molybdopterin converting factor subunit 1 [Candidatus Opimibacter skivensis]